MSQQPRDPGEGPFIVSVGIVEDSDGFWLQADLDRQPYDRIGPFERRSEAEAAELELMEMLRQIGHVVPMIGGIN